ncbi:hypothetical protein IFM89_036482 [Coptis chinensis]|uniref:RNase H type-1 domain-containing protein n=1 Tax=Coptis chinensis TaxID=261450 RepID=A0A835ISK1_9MAGN|nr:hypothetical protein IFM89_036482 [Coptis chinensis]
MIMTAMFVSSGESGIGWSFPTHLESFDAMWSIVVWATSIQKELMTKVHKWDSGEEENKLDGEEESGETKSNEEEEEKGEGEPNLMFKKVNENERMKKTSTIYEFGDIKKQRRKTKVTEIKLDDEPVNDADDFKTPPPHTGKPMSKPHSNKLWSLRDKEKMPLVESFFKKANQKSLIGTCTSTSIPKEVEKLIGCSPPKCLHFSLFAWEQAGFIQGRCMQSNIGIASEMTNELKKKRHGDQHGVDESIFPAILVDEEDFTIWKPDPKGKFSIKSTFKRKIKQSVGIAKFGIGVYPKYSAIAWKLMHNYAATHEKIREKKIPMLSRALEMRECEWLALHGDIIKINFDGASLGNLGNAGIEFVFINSNCLILMVLAKGIGVATNYTAECNTTVESVEVAIAQNWCSLWIESNSMLAVKAFALGNILWNLIGRWQQFKTRLNYCLISHTWREGNFAVDLATKFGASLDKDF